MALTLIEFLAPYYGPDGLHNAGEIGGVSATLATTLIAAGTAAAYNAGSGSGVPVASPFRGIGAGETPSAYQAAGGASNTTPSAAVQGFLSGSNVTIVDGRNVPNAESSWA